MSMLRHYLLSFWIVVAAPGLHLLGQDQVQFTLSVEKEQVSPPEVFEAIVQASLEEGWHLYSMEVPPGGPIPTTITVLEDSVFAAAGPVVQPRPISWFDQNFGMQTDYFEKEATFRVPVQVKANAGKGDHSLNVRVRFMICTDSVCLPPQNRTLSRFVAVGELPAGSAAPPDGGPAKADGPVVAAEAGANGAASSSSGGFPAGTLAYIWFAMTMGALALLTPCVFPMIPITVSYFTKREAVSRKRTIFEAGIYSLGIIFTFTILGFSLTLLFGAGGINRLASSPLVNLAIAAVFLLFAFSLFGVIELKLPNSVLNAVNRRSSSQTGLGGILLMALTFSLTSFTCTVPFVGTVMVTALQGDFLWSLLGVTAFATIFSLPFFLLALFPSWLSSMPKSGNWMNSVKITMGFLELAAALKFISNVDMVFQWELITRPLFITVWLAIGLVTAAYLLGWFRFPHESESNSVGAVRVLFAILFFSVSFYLLRGLFGFPLGELDAFLPPRDYGNVAAFSVTGAAPGENGEEKWLTNYQAALGLAQQENKPIFIDFTGYTCTNCRWMESNIFPLPEVQALFKQYILVRLYTDGREEEHEENQNFEKERFGTIALPLYALMSPRDETIATFPGLTRSSKEFVEFLEKGPAAVNPDSRQVSLQQRDPPAKGTKLGE